MTLTARQIDQAKPKDKPYKLSDMPGLYLHVMPTGTKVWRTNYKLHGKQRTKTYGRWPEMTLAEARRAHTAQRVEEQDRQAPAFEAVMQDWLKIKLPALKKGKHQTQIVNTLERFVLPAIGKKPIDAITRKELVALVQAIQTDDGDMVETARRVAGRIGMVFDYAQDAGLIDSHPASHLARVLQERKRQKPMTCIPVEDVPALLAAIDTYHEPITRLGLLLAMHLFLRVSELRHMRWNWVQANDDVLLVPAELMKRPKPHVVPLSRQAQALLDELDCYTGGSEYALESPLRRGYPMSENTLLYALYRLGYRGRMTVHGFRSLASTVLNEQSPFKPDAIERQLAHREKDAVREAYHRAEYLPERRQMMQWWSDWLDSQRRPTNQNAASA